MSTIRGIILGWNNCFNSEYSFYFYPSLHFANNMQYMVQENSFQEYLNVYHISHFGLP